LKQGRASRDVRESWKRDPIPKAVSIDATSQVGQAMGNHITGKKKILHGVSSPLYSGDRGFVSPLGMKGTPGVGVNRNIYNKGSQGRR